MKSSTPPSASSSSSSVTSVSPALRSPSSPPQSLQSPELQAEFLRERQNRFGSHSEVSESSAGPPSSSSSPLPPSSLSSPLPPSSSSPSWSNGRRARLSLSSPELLSELRASRTRALRHMPAHKGLTTIFSGRGRGGQASGPAPSTQRRANQSTSP